MINMNTSMESQTSDQNENSDDGLQIVIDSPKSKKKSRRELDECDKQIIASVEKDIEETLSEKAIKSNLTTINVKNLLKHVVTNEHVLALVRSVEDPEHNEPLTIYQPKCTRAKTKKLTNNVEAPEEPPEEPPEDSLKDPPEDPPTPENPPEKRQLSEFEILLGEELQEDSSDDEYVPHIKKTPDAKKSEASPSEPDEATIALRTRSKLSLSHTPLEKLNETLIPPDMTTDMYDMDCDDDVWQDFLTTIAKPLEEVAKVPEDEEHDPEYNILADEEIDTVDKEELRADRAVTVSRKEFNDLMAELFEFADIYESNQPQAGADTTDDKEPLLSEPDSEEESEVMSMAQVSILAQHMRQHVQMLAQNFILTYQHPEYGDMALKYKEYLMALKDLSDDKTVSMFQIVNLDPALALVEYWEQLYERRIKPVKDDKKFVERVIVESIEAKKAGIEYIPQFPPLILKTISESDVFIYPKLLARIPFKSKNAIPPVHYVFNNSENNLIALFLEVAIPILREDPFHYSWQNKDTQVNMGHVADYIHKYLIPCATPTKIWRHMQNKKHKTSEDNPIKYYINNRRAPPTLHFVEPFAPKNILPPCKNAPELLPYQWRKYLYPDYDTPRTNPPKLQEEAPVSLPFNTSIADLNNSGSILISPLDIVPLPQATSTPVYLLEKRHRPILPKEPLPPIAQVAPRKRRSCTKKRPAKNANKSASPQNCSIVISSHFDSFNQIIIEEVSSFPEMDLEKLMPDMPCLSSSSPLKQAEVALCKAAEPAAENRTEQTLTFKNIASYNFPYYQSESVSKSKTGEKDNPDDINNLMIASATVKNVPKKEPSGAEKKRAKLRREFVSNLAMVTPENPEAENQSDEKFADDFYQKLKDTLSPDDYNKLISLLTHFDETCGQFKDLYKGVQSVLLPKHKDLSDEFLLFLSEIQAYQVGQLMPYFMMKDMGRFMKKLQFYFKDQPFQFRKIIKCFTDLTEIPDVTMENIKSAILPLLKGNATLIDWFLQIFPSERPPISLTNGPYEVVDIAKELSRPPDEEIYETITVPDSEDPYGGPNCICTCHNIEQPQFQSRTQHCSKCGLKFIQGKVYIQTGKALRRAVVSFLTNPEKDHTKRLSATPPHRKRETSPSKQVAVPHDENRNSNESDEDCEGNKKKAKARKRTLKRSKASVDKEGGDKPNEISPKSKSPATKQPKSAKKAAKRKAGKKIVEHKPGSTTGQQKRLAEESLETESESAELKVGSEQSESESECCESSRVATNSESEDSGAGTSPEKGVSWTRDEDKTILQAFRQRGDKEATFKYISQVLQNRSIAEIKNRFHKLMSLLQEMAAANSET